MRDDASALARFGLDMAKAGSMGAAFAALERLAQATVGVRLFTVMLLDHPALLARRAYSSHPAEYPTSGTKPIEPNPWFAQVVEGRQTFVANTLAEIARVFPDHALIGSLGCGAVINVPVVDGDRVIGTVNLLDSAGRYTPQVATRATSILAAPATRVLRRATAS